MKIKFRFYLTLLSSVIIFQYSFGQENGLKEIQERHKELLWSSPNDAIDKEKQLLLNPKLDDTLRTKCYKVIAVGYSILAVWDSAFHYHHKTLKSAQAIENEQLISLAHNNIGILHLAGGDTLLAHSQFNIAKDYIINRGTAKEKANFLRALIKTCPQDSLRKTIKYANQAIVYYKEAGDSIGISYCYVQLAEGYLDLNKLDSVKTCLNLAEVYSDVSKNTCNYTYMLRVSGLLHLREGQIDKAISILKKGVDALDRTSFCNQGAELYHYLSEAYAESGEYSKAIEYRDKHYNSRIQTSIDQAKVRSNSVNFDDLRSSIERLSEEHLDAVSSVSLLKNKNIIASEQLRTSRFRFWTVCCFSLLAIGLIIFLYKQSKRLKAQRKELYSSQNQLIEIGDRQKELVLDIQKKNEALVSTNKELSLVKSSLIHSEKMNAIGTLSAGIAHELNNPLNFISGGIDVLSNNLDKEGVNLDNEDLVKVLNMMKEGSSRAQFIIKNLRKFTRKGQSENMEVVSAKDLVEQSSSLLLQKFTMQNISFEIKEIQENLYVKCNTEAIVLSLVNLLINATQAIKDNGRIVVSIFEEKDSELVTIAVEDNGVGIDPKVIQQVFDPFFTTRTQESNSGLGLYLVHTLVNASGGDVEVNSELGSGAQFFIRLIKVKST